MSWISFPNDILVELSTKYSTSQSSPHMTFTSIPIRYALDLQVVACYLAIHQREFTVFDLLQTKNNYATHQHCFLVLVASCSFAKPYNDGVTSCKHLASPQLRTPMYTTFSLSTRKCNIMLSLDKSLYKIQQWCIAFIMLMNALANFINFIRFCLKATNHVHPSLSSPPAIIRYDYQ
jgi:hypothetical protein